MAVNKIYLCYRHFFHKPTKPINNAITKPVEARLLYTRSKEVYSVILQLKGWRLPEAATCLRYNWTSKLRWWIGRSPILSPGWSSTTPCLFSLRCLVLSRLCLLNGFQSYALYWRDQSPTHNVLISHRWTRAHVVFRFLFVLNSVFCNDLSKGNRGD